MLSQRVKQLSILYDLPLQLLAASGVGLILGVVALWLSPLWALAGLAGVGLLLVILKRPEIGVLAILAITSTIIPQASLPRIPIGIGTVYIPDILLFGLMGLIVIRRLVEPGFKIVRTPLDLPLLAFSSIALLATALAILHSSLTFNESLGKIRTVGNYLTFFLVTNLAREEHQIRLLLRGIFALATVVAVAMIAQFLVGPAVPILTGRVETLATEGEVLSGLARIIPPGYSLVFVAFTSETALITLDKSRRTNVIRFLAPWIILGAGVLLTFKRHLWGGLGLVFCLLFVYSGRTQTRQRWIGWGLVVAILAMIALVLSSVEPDSKVGGLVRASLGRLGSLANTATYEDPKSSVRWRDFEYRYALPQIAAHPLLGLGLGAKYRPWVSGKDNAEFDGRNFIHNGHIAIVLQTGLLGYLSWLWLALVFLFRGLRYARYSPSPQLRACVVGFALAWLVVLFTSVVEPMVIESYWTSLIGVMMGVNELILFNHVGQQPQGNVKLIRIEV